MTWTWSKNPLRDRPLPSPFRGEWSREGAGRGLVRLALAGWLLAAVMAGCRSQVPVPPPEAPSPAGPLLLTATGAIRSLAVDRAGSLWAATAGGALCWPPGAAAPRRWTAAEGLPDSDVRAVRPGPAGEDVTTATGRCRIGADGHVQALPAPEPAAVPPRAPEEGTVTAVVHTPDALYLAMALDLWRQAGDGRWRRVALPPGSPASHVSALCAHGGEVIAGLYGDGLYRLAGTRWRPLGGTPPACRFATALALAPTGLAVGTQADGVWQQEGGHWRRRPDPSSLPSADVQTLGAYGGALWVGTLDGGLLQYDGARVRRWTQAAGLRAASPRGLTVFGGKLYVRYATGEADCYDGHAWQPAFTKADLPRPEVYALAADSHFLFAGGWAGWAATDGKVWERHDHDPELAGQVVTAIAPGPDGAVWIGTQKQGLLRYRDGRYERYQEAQGLTDDWITCIAVRADRILVGTYTGGLLERRGERFVQILDPQRFAVRTLAFAREGRALAATPLGVYRETASGTWRPLAARLSGGLETQALLPLPAGLWVGSRTGLAFVPRDADG